MIRVLITGAGSYIGTSFTYWASRYYSETFQIDTIDMIDGSWREKSFAGYDAIFHVAGIAHADTGRVSEDRKAFYYKINRDLAIETARKAKCEGVKQFLFMSSMIIYGKSAGIGKKKVITRQTKPHPENFYGDSKWQADYRIRELNDETFAVAVLRPPMIYGKGCKGNYPVLAKMAKKIPCFPNIKNERSMLYIENLCEFLSQVLLRKEGGIFWPQNVEYSSTSELVRLISEASGHKVRVSKTWNWVVWLASKVPGRVSALTNKAFGNISYDKKMSQYDFEYQLVSLQESIKRIEG